MQKALNWILLTLFLAALTWFVMLLSRLNAELISKESFPQLFVITPLLPLLFAAFFVNLSKKKLRFSIIAILIALILGSILSITPALVSSYWSVYLAIIVIAASALLIASIEGQTSIARFTRLFLLISGLSIALILALECEYPESYTAGWIGLFLAFGFTILSALQSFLTSRK